MYRIIHRCHYTHRAKRTSFLRPLMFSYAYSKKSSPQPSRLGKLSNNVVSFLQNESKALENAIREPDIPYDHQNYGNNNDMYSSLDPSIRSQLDRTFELHRKLLILLSCKPSKKRIDPELYIHLHKQLDSSPLDVDQINLLIRRLTFHRKFDYIWKVIEDGGSTLTDIEDYIEVICMELKSCNYFEIGLLEVISSARNVIKSSGLKNSIIDTICFKYGKSRSNIEDETLRLLGYRTTISLPNIIDMDPIMELPGFISYVSSPFSVKDLVSSNVKFELNENDIQKVLESSSPNDYHLLYPYYKDILKVSEPDFVDKLLTSMMKQNATENIVHCLQSLNSRISNEILTQSLAYIYIHSSIENWLGIYSGIPMKVEKRAQITENFAKVVLNSMKLIYPGPSFESEILTLFSVLHKNDLLQRNVLSTILNSMDQPATFSFYLEVLRLGLDMSNFIDLVSNICQKHSERDNFRKLTTDNTTSGELYQNLFQTFLYTNFKRQREEGVDDYRKIYINSTKYERSKSIHRLHLFCKPISQLSLKQIANILNSLEHFVNHSGDFKFESTSYGRKHLLDKFIAQIMLEIDRKHKSHRGMHKIRDIIDQFEFNSTTISHELLYQYLTKYNPYIPFKIASEFSSNKSSLTNQKMKGMMIGMLTTPYYPSTARVEQYFKFCEHLKSLGYNTSTKKKPIIMLIDLIVNIKVENPSVEFNNFEDILKIAMQRRVKKSLLLHWSRKLMLLEELTK